MRLRSLLPLLLPLALGACSLLELGDETRAYYASTVLVGRVESHQGWRGAVEAGAYRAGPAPELVHRVWLHEPGGFELIVPNGEYRLFAFADTDGNGRPDPGEPAAGLGPVRAEAPGVLPQLDMLLEADTPLPAALASLLREHPLAQAGPGTQAGALAVLDDPLFSAENGRHGYWAPLQFFREGSTNLYFLEPYDPARIPVLFIHGAAGSAQDWRPFVEQLDRSRYQAWFFQYPSGAAVDAMAYLLYWKLLNLQTRYHFERLHLVAHSAGGLVARSFLVRHGGQFPVIGAFVSLSTPWAGEAAAELGVRHAPAVLPSWHDMRPDGRLLHALFEQPLPEGIAYYLLFSHRGGYSLLRPNHDGAVTLASQLRDAAQAEARRIFGFDEDHTGILASPQALAQVQAILARHDQRDALLPAGGLLRVAFQTIDPEATPKGLPSLALRPLNGTPDQAPLLFPFSAAEPEPAIGPVPPGDYAVSLLMPGFASEPAMRPLRIDAGPPPLAAFTLRPRGELIGYVATDSDAPGNPAGVYLRPHPEPRLRGIELHGPDGVRRLDPARAVPPSPAASLARHLKGEDHLDGARFAFYDLPAGDYELRIESEQAAPHVSRHHVVPGQVTPLPPVVLAPGR